MLVIIDIYSTIITNMCIISPSQASGKILSCQLTSVKSTSIHQRGFNSGTYKKKGPAPPIFFFQWSPLLLRKIGRGWPLLSQETVLLSLSSRAVGLFSSYIHITKRGLWRILPRTKRFPGKWLAVFPIRDTGSCNSIAASLVKMKTIKFCTLICMQSARHCYQW